MGLCGPSMMSRKSVFVSVAARPFRVKASGSGFVGGAKRRAHGKRRCNLSARQGAGDQRIVRLWPKSKIPGTPRLRSLSVVMPCVSCPRLEPCQLKQYQCADCRSEGRS